MGTHGTIIYPPKPPHSLWVVVEPQGPAAGPTRDKAVKPFRTRQEARAFLRDHPELSGPYRYDLGPAGSFP